jgi:hypothetical protein
MPQFHFRDEIEKNIENEKEIKEIIERSPGKCPEGDAIGNYQQKNEDGTKNKDIPDDSYRIIVFDRPHTRYIGRNCEKIQRMLTRDFFS